MSTIWVYVHEDNSCTIFYSNEHIPISLMDKIEKVENPPSGEGDLYKAEDGSFYYKTIPEVTDPPIIGQPTEPHPPVLIEEMQAQILLNTEYLVSRTELGLGGI